MRAPVVLPLWLLAFGCGPAREVGAWSVTPTDSGLDVTRADGSPLLTDLRIAVGTGSAEVEFSAGAYRFDEDETRWTDLRPAGPGAGGPSTRSWRLEDAAGAERATLNVAAYAPGILAVVVAAADPAVNRVRLSSPCTGNDHVAGFGQHAQDVDHVGEAFPLWVSEAGIGKSGSDDPGDDWFLSGTKHASGYPDPFFIRADPLGVELVTTARIDVDLCTGDRWSTAVWSGQAEALYYDVATPLEAVQRHALRAGVPMLPPEWAFAPWNDAVGGEERVRTVASELRESGATSGVIWTEDWKGGEDGSYGYHLLPNWEIDPTLYPDAEGLAADLAAQGFDWFAYFQPFVVEGTTAWDEAKDWLIRDADGAPYTFTGVTLEPTSVLDLTRPEARAWAEGKMQAARDLGFTGWMADFAEWLPTDAVLADGDALAEHNAYPLWWQDTNAAVLNGAPAEPAHPETDGVMFTRSGWTGTPERSPVSWAGDQRTSFDADDGFPTVVPMGIGAGIAGVPLYTHDIGGYQSLGNAPSTKELWWRWCTLGAMTPIMRTHHGAFKDDNWQFDTDADTLALYARWSRIHAQLTPYLRGLAYEAQRSGTPLVRAPFLVYPDERWDRTDAWLLGDLLVAPVMAEGATSRQVDLPAGAAWFDYWTGDAATSGVYDVPLDQIAVFAPQGAIVPTYTDAPDTLRDGPLPGVVTRDEVDTARTVTVFGSGATAADWTFTEADGTTYTVTGACTGPGTTAGQTSNGTLTVSGLTVRVTSPVERVYTVIVR